MKTNQSKLLKVFIYVIVFSISFHVIFNYFFSCYGINCFKSCEDLKCETNETCKIVNFPVCDEQSCRDKNEAKCFKSYCLLPMNPGVGYSSLKRYYYDYKTNTCEQFSYKGYVGNLNNFETEYFCQITCNPSGFASTLSHIVSYNHLKNHKIVGRINNCTKNIPSGLHLTFDDGPVNYTNYLLDTLKTYSISATFFVVAKNALLYPNLIKRMVDEGHTIGLHTFSHINIVKQERLGNFELIHNEIIKSERALEKMLPTRPWIFRPPYGGITPNVTKYLNDRGYLVMTWNAGCVDWKQKFINKSIENVSKGLKKRGGIVTFHDYVYETAFNMSNFIKAFSVGKKYYHPFISLEECLKS